jgi:hypothetical protein
LPKRRELKRLSAKADGRRHPVGKTDISVVQEFIKETPPAKGPVACTNRAHPKSAARRACPRALADDGKSWQQAAGSEPFTT